MMKYIHFYILLLFLLLPPLEAKAVPDSWSLSAIQYCKNFSGKDYGGDNRNMAIVCDSTGRVYVANFRGLLTYDGVSWRMTYTEGINRITCVYKAKNGKIWFGGSNVLGSVEWRDSVRLDYIVSDKPGANNKEFGEVSSMYETDGNICFTTNFETAYRIEDKKLVSIPFSKEEKKYNGTLVYVPENGYRYYATSKKGVACLNADNDTVYWMDSADGLPSDMINDIAYDGKGGIWGATNNGVFWMWVPEVFTNYTEHHGLVGRINSVREIDGELYVSTMEGLFLLDRELYRFKKVEDIHLACWELSITYRKHLIAATTEGIFIHKEILQQLTDKTAISVYVENDDSFITGELDGIYRHYYDGRTEFLGRFSNVSKIVKALDGKGLWAISNDGYGKTYYLAEGAKEFVPKKNENLTLLFSYLDDKNVRWKSKENDKGLVCESLSGEKAPEYLVAWLEGLDEMTIQAMFVANGLAWIGTNEGLVLLDMQISRNTPLYRPNLYIRAFRQNDNNVYVAFSNDKIDPIGKIRYSYRLNSNDRWSAWDEDKDYNLKLAPGDYELEVRSKDAFGQIATSEVIQFSVPNPWYLRWYSILGYILFLGTVGYLYTIYRTRKMRQEKERLEKIVDERTQEVVKQKDEIEAQKDAIVKQKDEIEAAKDEIEAKSESLATALSDLKNAQNQLLRQEREATVGKLTKGLIDRILNPLNYINNFSHLTIGLVKDMKGNVDDLKDEIEDNDELKDNDDVQELFEDSEDVLDMMNTNLQKIEEHGLSTTKILKAMEELLKDRSGKIEATDIKLLCQQNHDMLTNYYAADIKKYGIKVVWEKPEDPIVADVNAELMSKCVMSMLANSIYAVKKKADKGTPNYVPEVRLSINPPKGELPPRIEFYDNGIGIEESILDKIFDPFFTTKPTAEAPGVGLYLCQQIIQDFGGQITVKSEKDVYTEFRIELP